LAEKGVRRMLAQVTAHESSLHAEPAILATDAIRATPIQKSAALANLSAS
jgi:hypothetical protein